MTFKKPREMVIIISVINIHVYMEILDNFLLTLIENWFGDHEVIFQDDYTSCHRTKGIKFFLRERHIESMARPANSLNLNPIENLFKCFIKKLDLLKNIYKLPFGKFRTILIEIISLDYWNPCLEELKFSKKLKEGQFNINFLFFFFWMNSNLFFNIA